MLNLEAKRINEISEVNIFLDDNKVLHFKKPTLDYSLKEKCSFLTGTPETKGKLSVKFRN